MYDAQIRPGLMLDVIGEITRCGIEPDIWKIEGSGYPVRLRRHCPHGVPTTVAGCGAWFWGGAPMTPGSTVGCAGASVPGYSGFAIGRSIWWDALAAWHAGTMERQAAVEMIAANYRRFIDGYLKAAETSNA